MMKQEKLNRRFDAYNEVYIILNYLEKEEYKKIPQRIITTIDYYRNKSYEYKLNEKLDLMNQKMMPETKAILFNIFRDYLSTDEQRSKIKRMQREDLERSKQKEVEDHYNENFTEKLKLDEELLKERDIDTKEKKLIRVEKENFIRKLINKIKQFCTKR